MNLARPDPKLAPSADDLAVTLAIIGAIKSIDRRNLLDYVSRRPNAPAAEVARDLLGIQRLPAYGPQQRAYQAMKDRIRRARDTLRRTKSSKSFSMPRESTSRNA